RCEGREFRRFGQRRVGRGTGAGRRAHGRRRRGRGRAGHGRARPRGWPCGSPEGGGAVHGDTTATVGSVRRRREPWRIRPHTLVRGWSHHVRVRTKQHYIVGLVPAGWVLDELELDHVAARRVVVAVDAVVGVEPDVLVEGVVPDEAVSLAAPAGYGSFQP